MKSTLAPLVVVPILALVATGCGSKAAAPAFKIPRVLCPAAVPDGQVGKPGMTWKTAPPDQVKNADSYTICIRTTAGNIVASLMPKAAHQVVNSFVFLADHKFYNDVPLRSRSSKAMVRAGITAGGLNPGYGLPIANPGNNFVPKTVAMWHASGSTVNGGQFFICASLACSGLDNSNAKGHGYTVFGFVDGGMNVVRDIAKERAGNKVRIKTIQVFVGQAPPSIPADDMGS